MFNPVFGSDWVYHSPTEIPSRNQLVLYDAINCRTLSHTTMAATPHLPQEISQ